VKLADANYLSGYNRDCKAFEQGQLRKYLPDEIFKYSKTKLYDTNLWSFILHLLNEDRVDIYNEQDKVKSIVETYEPMYIKRRADDEFSLLVSIKLIGVLKNVNRTVVKNMFKTATFLTRIGS